MGVYTSSQNSNSLVINSSGRTVYSNPGSPKTSSVMDALKHNHQRTSYCDSQLPLPVHTDPTLVIADDNHSAYCNAFSNSNTHIVMSQMGGACGAEGDDLPNETCNSRNSNKEKLNATKMLLSQRSFPVDPLQGGSSVYFQQNPTDFLAGPYSGSIDLSVLADSNSMDMASGLCAPPEEGGVSSMVTGVGGGGGSGPTQILQPPPYQHNQANVFESDMDTMIREIVTTSGLNPSLDMGLPDLDLLKSFDSGLDPSVLSECLSTPVNADFINGFDGMSVQPIQAQSPSLAPLTPVSAATPTSRPDQNWGSVQEQQSTIGDNFDMIKMMNVQLKPSAPTNLGLKQSHMVPKGHIPSPLHTENLVPPSPGVPPTPYTPPMAPVEVSAPSPAPPTPQTPMTPCVSQKGPFELKTYVEEGHRFCEISVRDNLPEPQHQVAVQAMHYSLETHLKITQCLKLPCDLKVAIDARAELCGAKFDQESCKLQFTMPKDLFFCAE